MKSLLLIAALVVTGYAQNTKLAESVAAAVAKAEYKAKHDPEMIVTNTPIVGDAVQVKLSVDKKMPVAEAKKLTDTVLAAIRDRIKADGLEDPAWITVLAVHRYKYFAPIGEPTYRVDPARITTYRIGRVWTTYISGGRVREVRETVKRNGETNIAASEFENLPQPKVVSPPEKPESSSSAAPVCDPICN